MMSIILAKTDYIISSNETLINLKEFNNSFREEAHIIWHLKCMVMKNEEIDDFYADGNYVEVYKTNDGFFLKSENHEIEIKVFDRQIIDYHLR